MDQDIDIITSATGEEEAPRPGSTLAVALLRAHKQVPEIATEKQYELYLYLYRNLLLTANLGSRDDPLFHESLRAYVRTRDGILARIYRERMMKWRKKGRCEPLAT
jgi:hypothetical protein